MTRGILYTKGLLSTKLREFLIRNQLPYVGKLKSIAKVIPILKSKEATQIVDLIFSIKQKGTLS